MLDKRVFQWCDALNEVQTVSTIEHSQIQLERVLTFKAFDLRGKSIAK